MSSLWLPPQRFRGPLLVRSELTRQRSLLRKCCSLAWAPKLARC
jgi:hypothetical protein